ncbi:pseudouridine synthase [Maribacter sp. X9]|uniref:pseudouridine synthase n=1 Tax=Maribacter sp. X9 TaxID=3402159 RepID=UPI003AF3749F
MEQYHFKIYKPFGMLSQMTSSEDRQLRKKHFLSELYDFPKGIMPIGRLDEKSEGLLLMTTDGKLSDTINSSGIEKEYLAQLDGEITGEAIEMLSKGVRIGIFGKNYSTKPCVVKLLDAAPTLPEADSSLRIGRHRTTSWISITLTEGKFRQIRKMTAVVGFPTQRLIRVRIGNIHINRMVPREVLPLASKAFSI